MVISSTGGTYVNPITKAGVSVAPGGNVPGGFLPSNPNPFNRGGGSGGGGGGSSSGISGITRGAEHTGDVHPSQIQGSIGGEHPNIGTIDIGGVTYNVVSYAGKEWLGSVVKESSVSSVTPSGTPVNVNPAGGVTIGEGQDAVRYTGNAYIKELGMTANQYNQSLREQAVASGQVSQHDVGRVKFIGEIPNPIEEAQPQQIIQPYQLPIIQKSYLPVAQMSERQKFNYYQEIANRFPNSKESQYFESRYGGGASSAEPIVEESSVSSVTPSGTPVNVNPAGGVTIGEGQDAVR